MKAPRSGWAYGDRNVWNGEQSRYLTILGSAHTAPKFYPTQEAAQAALDVHPCRDNPHMHMTVAHVTEIRHSGVTGRGYAYPITGAFDAEDA